MKTTSIQGILTWENVDDIWWNMVQVKAKYLLFWNNFEPEKVIPGMYGII